MRNEILARKFIINKESRNWITRIPYYRRYIKAEWIKNTDFELGQFVGQTLQENIVRASPCTSMISNINTVQVIEMFVNAYILCNSEHTNDVA